MYGEIVDNSLPNKGDAEDKIFNLCMVEIEEFPLYLTKLDDIKGIFHQRYLSKSYKDLNLDSVRERTNESLINIEHHSSINKYLLVEILNIKHHYMQGLKEKSNLIYSIRVQFRI